MPGILLEAEGIRKSYGMRTVLAIDTFTLYDGDRIGLVGENGAGKSTFLKILAGVLEPDEGRILRFAGVSMIAQTGDTDQEIGDARMRSEFSAQEAQGWLSGGEKTRRRIAGALSGGGHVLLADEPTTDLDAEGIARLEKYLKEFNGAVVLISHDRALLDAVTDRTAELEEGKLTFFPGGYSAWREEKEQRREHQRFLYDQYRGEQKRIREMIQREVEHASQKQKLPSRMGNSEARLHKREVTNVQATIHKTRKTYETRLNRLEQVDRPREDPEIAMRLGTATPITSRTAVEVRGLYMRAGGVRSLLENASFRIPVGSCTVLTGPNGCGKTTLLRRITGAKNDPTIRISPGVKIGRFDQDHADTLDPEKTALENAMLHSVCPESTVRTVLARLNLRGDDVFKPLKVLSGGEAAKVALASLFTADINLLLLDEPTNHLDLFTLEALQEVLKDYGGTVLAVSHDRRFIREVAGRLLFVEGKGITTFEGTWEEYEASKTRDRSGEELRLELTRLQMRLAAIASRMSAPKKGDSPERLNAEYEQVLEEIRLLKQSETE